MASRQEEKEARRQARIEQEEADRRASARAKRLRWVASGAVGLILVVVVVVFAATSGGPKHKAGANGASAHAVPGVKLPAQKISDVSAAAQAAGCTLTNPPDEGRSHINKTFHAADYKTNPPTSGAHYPVWAQDGIYTQATEPQLGEFVHTLEHGRIDVQYQPGASKQLVNQLQTLVSENKGYHMLLFPNQTNMTPQVAATAWDHALLCPSVNAKTWDALRTFRDAHLDKGPEKIP
jgi:hypothetical protein